MRSTQWLIGVVAGVLISGCTPSVRVTKNPADNCDGIRYYRPKPYLLIMPAGLVHYQQEKPPAAVPKGSAKAEYPGNPSLYGDASTRSSDALRTVAAKADADGGNKTEIVASIKLVEIKLEYLPDFTEEYAISVRPGLGVAEVGITLQDGWNLTGINQKLDSKFAETLAAAAGIAKTAASAGGAPRATQDFTPSQFFASNVPFGYYEAVISADPNGCKRLYGWRYVGFMPTLTCPA